MSFRTILFKIVCFITNLLRGTGLKKIRPIEQVYNTITNYCLKDKNITVNTRLGFKVQVDTNKFINNTAYTLLFAHSYESITTQVFKKLLTSGDVVVDVGANIGYFTLLAASIVGRTGSVFSFEPNPDTIQELRKNIKLNGFTNIYTEQVAVSDRKGTATFYICNENTICSLHENELHDSNITVTIDKLDNILCHLEVKLLKTDTEGNELAVLRGAESIIKRSEKISLITEIWQEAKSYSVNELFEYIESLGMRVFYAISDHKSRYKEGVVRCYRSTDIEKAFSKKNSCTNLLCMRRDYLNEERMI